VLENEDITTRKTVKAKKPRETWILRVISRYQDIKISRYQDIKISRYQDSNLVLKEKPVLPRSS